MKNGGRNASVFVLTIRKTAKYITHNLQPIYFWIWEHAVSNIAQKKTLRNYRTRLAKRGMARFEVLGLDTDRDLIRSLAKRLAEGGPDAAQIRAAVSQIIAGETPRRAAFSPHCVARRWSEPISISPALMKPAARSPCDALSPRHQCHQQRLQAKSVSDASRVDGGGTE
jgi:hypothetical protein